MGESASPNPSKDDSKMGKKIAEQARQIVREQDKKRADLASGRKRFTEGK